MGEGAGEGQEGGRDRGGTGEGQGRGRGGSGEGQGRGRGGAGEGQRRLLSSTVRITISGSIMIWKPGCVPT